MLEARQRDFLINCIKQAVENSKIEVNNNIMIFVQYRDDDMFVYKELQKYDTCLERISPNEINGEALGQNDVVDFCKNLFESSKLKVLLSNIAGLGKTHYA